jgi:hypothetical protein
MQRRDVDLEIEVLAVLRARLDESVLLKSQRIREALKMSHVTDRSYLLSSQELLRRAIGSLPVDLVHGARLMAGLLPETGGALIQRGDILEKMGGALPRRNRAPDIAIIGLPLTKRQIYNIEEKEIAPRVAALLVRPRKEQPLLYEDVSVVITLEPSKDPGLLDVGIEMSLTYSEELWIVAVTPDAVIADSLCKAHLQVNEVLCPSSNTDLPVMSVATRRISDARTPSTVRDLREISEAEFAQFIPTMPLQPYPNVRWFVSWCQDELGSEESLRLAFCSVQSVGVAARHVYWSSPRLLELQSLTFRWRGFPRADDYHFRVEPFFEDMKRCDFDHHMRTCQIEVGTLVRRGSGAVLIWGDDAT